MSEEKYLIWSVEHSAWWGPERNGYTAAWSVAGAYSKEDAFQISAQSNWAELSEIPVPVSFFDYQQRCHAAIKNVKA